MTYDYAVGDRAGMFNAGSMRARANIDRDEDWQSALIRTVSTLGEPMLRFLMLDLTE